MSYCDLLLYFSTFNIIGMAKNSTSGRISSTVGFVIFMCLFSYAMFLVCNYPFCSPIDQKLPNIGRISLKSVSFGEIKKEKVTESYIRVDYPCQVMFCIDEIDWSILKKNFSGYGNGLYINQEIITNDGERWSYEAWIPFASTDYCFKCNIYEPYNNSVNPPREKLVQGNIKLYKYRVDLKYSGERRFLFSGVEINK